MGSVSRWFSLRYQQKLVAPPEYAIRIENWAGILYVFGRGPLTSVSRVLMSDILNLRTLSNFWWACCSRRKRMDVLFAKRRNSLYREALLTSVEHIKVRFLIELFLFREKRSIMLRPMNHMIYRYDNYYEWATQWIRSAVWCSTFSNTKSLVNCNTTTAVIQLQQHHWCSNSMPIAIVPPPSKDYQYTSLFSFLRTMVGPAQNDLIIVPEMLVNESELLTCALNLNHIPSLSIAIWRI